MNADRIAQEILAYRAEHILDHSDIAWYVAEEGLDEATHDAVYAAAVARWDAR